MRGAFAVVLLSLVGSAGCSDAAADIQATQHGKRLDLVTGADTTTGDVDLKSVTTNPRPLGHASAPSSTSNALYRDVAGVVLADPKNDEQRLEQWLLTQDGTAVFTRNCPVKAAGGVDFGACLPWGYSQTLADLDLTSVGPIRSFSTYLFSDASQGLMLAEVAFNMAGDERVERTCPTVGESVTWSACSTWLSLEESAAALGVPRQSAFEDEVVVPYADKQGNPQFTQQLITTAGDAAWARSCAMSEGQIPGVGGSCAFSPQVRLAALGIHFDAVQGVGGYAYLDNGARIYAQTAIATDGVSAARRLCPITPEGVDFGQCLGWESIDLTMLAVRGAAL
jgi:hypothetical protein